MTDWLVLGVIQFEFSKIPRLGSRSNRGIKIILWPFAMSMEDVQMPFWLIVTLAWCHLGFTPQLVLPLLMWYLLSKYLYKYFWLYHTNIFDYSIQILLIISYKYLWLYDKRLIVSLAWCYLGFDPQLVLPLLMWYLLIWAGVKTIEHCKLWKS